MEKKMIRRTIALLIACAFIVTAAACKPITPTSPSGSPPPAIVGGGNGDDPRIPEDREPMRDNPKGPGWKIGEIQPGSKIVTAGAWVFNKQGETIHARVLMVFNAVVQHISGDAPQISVRGDQQWDSTVDSGYRWPTEIQAGFPYSIVFEVSVTYVGGRAGDKVGCSITSDGGVLVDDYREVMGTAPVTAHCFVSVTPPPKVA